VSLDAVGAPGTEAGRPSVGSELDRRRRTLGTAAEMWAPGQVKVDGQRWAAMSGAPSVDYNVIVCYGGGEVVETAVLAGLETRVPFVMMLAGRALGEAQVLMDRDWICAGSVPFMRRELPMRDRGAALAAAEQAAVRRLGPDQLAEAQELVDVAFALGPDLARAAVPASAVTTPGQAVWGIADKTGRLVSCMSVARVEQTASVWWMSTPPDRRREGHASRLLSVALDVEAAEGARECLLYASEAGEPFWEAMGFETLERWQIWSRPRWMLGRS
jgi:GNAT superfamily N-acetyltransferase